MIAEHEKWMLSYYRTSEISGAMFLARLAKSARDPLVQRNLTAHFADEAQHARYWSDCLEQLGLQALRLGDSYQNQYFDAIGVPVNMMEVLAITKVFEARVINHYTGHAKRTQVHPVIRATIDKIMADEAWHLKWVSAALKTMEADYGSDAIAQTLARYKRADEEIYRKAVQEHDERASELAALSH